MPSEKTTFQAGMYMKTKRGEGVRCQVSGARCEGTYLHPEVQASGFARVRSEKTTFQAGMCMKTLNDEGASGDVDENKGPPGKRRLEGMFSARNCHERFAGFIKRPLHGTGCGKMLRLCTPSCVSDSEAMSE
jgi:hypothetical protein